MGKAALAGFALCSALGCAGAHAETRVEVTRDNSIVLVDNEWHLNAGGQSRIRIKGNQHLVALAFDTQPLKGKLVRSATLVCQRCDAMIDGVTISTIMADWDEHKSSSLTSGRQPFEGWGWPGAKFPSVTGGNSFSLFCQAKSVLKDGAYHWQVEPDLIHANAIGAAYGLTLHEVSCDYMRNPTIFSREQTAKRPYLLVTFGGTERKPEPPTELKVSSNGDPESVRLRLRAPKDGFAYEVLVGSTPLPRWNVPFVRPGEMQMIPIRDLPLKAGAEVTFAVTTLNRLGERSAPALATVRLPAAKPVAFPEVPEVVSAGAPPNGIAIIPLEDKYDEQGRPVGDLPADYLTRSVVFDGKTIRLNAARGEVVGFQALLKGTGTVRVECKLAGLRTEMNRALYVGSPKGRIPDPLVPFEELQLSPDVATPVCVDVYVPFEFTRESVEGALSVSDGRQVPIRLKVRGFAIPREASFFCEMNSYGLPDKASDFYRLQEIAYDHRCHINILCYSHRTAAPGARKCNMDMVMASGRRMDERRYNDIAPGAKRGYWDDFVAVFGPYLSGSHFKGGHRGPVPAPGFYLTFHESWPLNVRAFFNGNPDAYEAFTGKPIYAETFVSILRDFIAVAQREGWTRTGFQVYLNNKGKLSDTGLSPWILDEPTEYWDYRALSYYGDLVRQAAGERCPVALRYRIDISRPEFDRGQLQARPDFWVASSDAFRNYGRLIADRAERTGQPFWVYGSSNNVEDSNRTILAWVLSAYRDGASGVLPWQTINHDGSALSKADQLGLFIFARRPQGPSVIHHSMRLKAYRRAQQDVEYLELLRKRLRLTPGQVRSSIDRYVDLGGTVVKRFSEDAGTARFGKLSPEGFRKLREATAALLERGN